MTEFNIDDRNTICKKCGYEKKYHRDVYSELDYFVLICDKFEPKVNKDG